MLRQCGWSLVRDITVQSFDTWRQKKTASPKTLNEYLNAVVCLTNWIDKRNGRTGWHPLAEVQRIDARGRQTFDRRALTLAEARALLKAAPAVRGVMYATAIYTGLRRGELEALRWQDVDLSEAAPVVRVRASTAKNRTDATLPIHPDLGTVLRLAKPADASPEDSVFPHGIPRACRGLRKDLEAALCHGRKSAATC